MATEKPKSLYDRVNERWLDLAFDRIFSTDEALEDAVVNEFREAQPGVSEHELREMVRRAAAHCSSRGIVATEEEPDSTYQWP